MHKIQLYPPSFPRNLDLIPLLSFQQGIDPNLELSYIAGSGSISLGRGSRDEFRSRDHDIVFRQNSENRQKTDIIFDGGSPINTLSQRQFWDEALDELGAEIPEIVILSRATREPIPKELEDHDKLSGLNSICQWQISRGNRTRELRRRFNITALSNPYRLIQADLRERGVWRREFSRRLRGVLKTESILGIDGAVGWTELFQFPRERAEEFRFPPLSSQLNRHLIRDKWWQDTGIPRRLLGRVDSQNVEAILYLLLRRHRIVAI